MKSYNKDTWTVKYRDLDLPDSYINMYSCIAAGIAFVNHSCGGIEYNKLIDNNPPLFGALYMWT